MIDKIVNDMKLAMKNQDKEKLMTLRMLKSSIQNEQIKKKTELSDEDVISILMKEIKSRKDANVEFEKGKRIDLIEKNDKEIKILEEYLPEMMEEEEISKIIDEVILKVNPKSSSDIGLVMRDVVPLVKGKADLSKVNELIKNKLNNL